MILHVVYDEKVINRSVENFELVYPGQNLFVVLVDSLENIKYVQPRECVKFEIYNTNSFWETVGDIKRYSSIVIHFLVSHSIDFVNRISHPRIYWIEWGADLYYSLLSLKGYQLYSSPDIVYKCSNSKLPKFLFNLKNRLGRIRTRTRLFKAIKKIRYFVPDSLYDEYPLLLDYYPEFSHLEYKEFFYYPINEVLDDDLIRAKCTGNSIMVGHSAGLTENYDYVFNLLQKVDIGERKILCPLSYGNSVQRERTIELGKKCFGSQFSPITSFLPLEDYNKILMSANIFIYGNWRQEAVGNILVALYLGGKVYLDRRNLLYNFYKNLGITLFELADLEKSINIPLSESEIEKNQRVIMTHYSKERLLALIKNNFVCYE